MAPNVLTWTAKLTGSDSLGFYLTSGFIIAGSLTLLIAMPARLLAARKSSPARPTQQKWPREIGQRIT